jgi:polysaccharide deacetylase 2 family uncharacterized protein YibQ
LSIRSGQHGAGLGALVGTGLTAIASLVAAPPAAAPAPVQDAAEATAATGTAAEAGSAPAVPATAPAAEAAEVPAPAKDTPAEDAPAAATPAEPVPAVETVETAPETSPPAEEGSAAAPESGPEAAAEPAPEATSEASAAPEPADQSAPAEPAPSVASAAPEPAAPAGAEALPQAPAAAEAPASAEPPQSPGTPAAEPAPAAPETPAAAPEVAGGPAPEAPAAPETQVAAADAPAQDLPAPGAADGPAQPGTPVAEASPATPEPPGPPPLTPEEEAMLRKIAEEGPGSALPADPGEADGISPEGGSLPGEVEAGIVQPEGDGSRLPADPGLDATADGVTIGRLPRIGAEAEAGAPAEDSRPIVAHARPFENPEAKPAYAIVLIDDGTPGTDRAALAALPFPVTFALDPMQPGAADQAAIYRAAGQEVVLLASALPKGAEAADVEVALEAMARALPETVAVMDLPERSFQADRPLASLVVAAIGGQGRGLLSWDEGLNAADQVARRSGIPAAVAFRDLDGDGEAAPVIRRYLDRAAFKAAQEGQVTVVGRTRPETVAAILEWTVEGRAATVALAPLTAVLSAE